MGWAGLVALAGCGWILAHDPPVKPTLTADCSGLDEERCGADCCDGWHDFHCLGLTRESAGRCEYAPIRGGVVGGGQDADPDD